MWGLSEYLTPGSCLSEYNYVRQCVRLEQDIKLCLQSTRNLSLVRTERDDVRDSHLTLEKILPNQSLVPPISFHNLSILLGKNLQKNHQYFIDFIMFFFIFLETLEGELTRVSSRVADGGNLHLGATAQAVKAICALLGGVETQHVSTTLKTLMHACSEVILSLFCFIIFKTEKLIDFFSSRNLMLIL